MLKYRKNCLQQEISFKKRRNEIKYNLYNDIQDTGKLRDSETALIDDGRNISYRDLISSSKSATSILKSAGLKEYSKCVLIGNDSSEYLIAALAILANHGVFVSAGKEINNIEFNELLAKIKIEFAIIAESFCGTLDPAGYREADPVVINNIKFRIFKKSRKRDAEFEKLNPAFIRFSSGTTGESKGVVLSHETIKARTESANSALRMTNEDCVLWLLPMAYHFAVTIMLFLIKGCTIDISVNNKQKQILEKLKNGKITFVYATPYHYGNMIRESKSSNNRKPDSIPSCVRMLISTAMPLTEKLFAEFAKTFGRNLNQAYGIIECGLPFINTKPDKSSGISVGRHISSYEVRLAIQDHSDSAGEIMLKGPGFFDAYYDPWIKSKDILLKGGWFQTGDLGTFAPGGYLTIVGRKKSVINFLGLKIFPEKIENLLNSHTSVSESRVFAKSHPDFGEIPFAEIVPQKGGEIDNIELTAFCAEHLTSHEVPQEFIQVKEIRKTKNGKILRE